METLTGRTERRLVVGKGKREEQTGGEAPVADEEIVVPAGRVTEVRAGGDGPSWVLPMLLVIAGLFLYLVRQILPPFVIAAVLAYLFTPVVSWMESRARIPRLLAVAIFYLMTLGPISILLWLVGPSLAREAQDLVRNTPEILRSALVQLLGSERVEILGTTVDVQAITRYVTSALLNALDTPAGALHFAAVTLETLVKAFLPLVLAFYLMVNPWPFAHVVLRLLPPEDRPRWKKTGSEIHQVLSRYLRGLLFLVTLMATATWLGLTLIFHLPHALPIALATGVLEIIPFLGPITAGAIAAMVGLFYGGAQFALGIAIFYLVLRQLEDQLVMPVVIGRVVELHPVVTIFAVLAGGVLAGILGALLAIPVAAALKVVFDHWRPEDDASGTRTSNMG